MGYLLLALFLVAMLGLLLAAGFGVFAMLRPSPATRRLRDVTVIAAGAALLPVLVERAARGYPILWVVVALEVVTFALVAPVLVKQWRDPS